MNLNELVQHGADFAKFAFEGSGELQPMWITEDNKGQRGIVMTPFDGPNAKTKVVRALRESFKRLNIQRYVFIVEAWMLDTRAVDKKVTENVIQGNVAVSDVPERIECIQVVGEDRDGTSAMGHYLIHRDKDGKPTLSEFKKLEGYDRSTGRLVGLLRDE